MEREPVLQLLHCCGYIVPQRAPENVAPAGEVVFRSVMERSFAGPHILPLIHHLLLNPILAYTAGVLLHIPPLIWGQLSFIFEEENVQFGPDVLGGAGGSVHRRLTTAAPQHMLYEPKFIHPSPPVLSRDRFVALLLQDSSGLLRHHVAEFCVVGAQSTEDDGLEVDVKVLELNLDFFAFHREPDSVQDKEQPLVFFVAL